MGKGTQGMRLINIKIQEINKEKVEFIPDNGGIRISASKRPEQSAQSSLLFCRWGSGGPGMVTACQAWSHEVNEQQDGVELCVASWGQAISILFSTSLRLSSKLSTRCQRAAHLVGRGCGRFLGPRFLPRLCSSMTTYSTWDQWDQHRPGSKIGFPFFFPPVSLRNNWHT